MTKTTNPNSIRVLRANAALLERGGRRMPGGYLQPDVASTLQLLISNGYAQSPVAVINRAILDAYKKTCKNPTKGSN